MITVGLSIAADAIVHFGNSESEWQKSTSETVQSSCSVQFYDENSSRCSDMYRIELSPKSNNGTGKAALFDSSYISNSPEIKNLQHQIKALFPTL